VLCPCFENCRTNEANRAEVDPQLFVQSQILPKAQNSMFIYSYGIGRKTFDADDMRVTADGIYFAILPNAITNLRREPAASIKTVSGGFERAYGIACFPPLHVACAGMRAAVLCGACVAILVTWALL
jgi:hypothetical protein